MIDINNNPSHKRQGQFNKLKVQTKVFFEYLTINPTLIKSIIQPSNPKKS